MVNEKLRSLKAAIDKFFSEKDYKIKTESRPFHPHITIATRDLLRKIFMKHGRSLKQKNYRQNAK